MRLHHVPKEVRGTLLNRDEFIELLRAHPTQVAAGEAIGVSVMTIVRAREYHNIPARAAKGRAIVPVHSKNPRDVLADPDAKHTLMERVYSRLGYCVPRCLYHNGKSCPKSEDPDGSEPGVMHEQCPVWFYSGSNRGMETTIQMMVRLAAMSLDLKEIEEWRGKAAVEAMIQEEPPLPEKPTDFKEFLQWVVGAESDAHYTKPKPKPKGV